MDEDMGFDGIFEDEDDIIDFEIGLPIEDDLYDFGQYDDDPNPYAGTYSEE